jgi:polysaccharide export outer membrane protein
LAAKRPTENIQVRPFDVISVPESPIVYVIGEVKKSGGFVLGSRTSMSVLEALSLAEGLQPRASPKSAKILRVSGAAHGTRSEIPVNVGKIMAGKAADVALLPDDILVIPDSAAKNAALRSVETALQIGTGLVVWRR